MGWRQREFIIRHTYVTWFRPAPYGALIHALTFLWRWVLWAPAQLAAWALTFMFAFSTLFGVGALLARQMKVKARGSTWLEELQSRRIEAHGMAPSLGQWNENSGVVGGTGDGFSQAEENLNLRGDVVNPDIKLKGM